MDDMKLQIEKKLVANVIKDKCAHNVRLEFSPSWCSQERVIRFTTKYMRSIFPAEGNGGLWETGDSVMYEVSNYGTSLKIDCVYSPSCVEHSKIESDRKILLSLCVPFTDRAVLYSFTIESKDGDINSLFDAFDTFVERELPAFEEKIDCLNEEYIEGKEENAISRKYERNRKAREACLKANGTACKVCGIDFAIEYGPEFAGKIEVHHIVPISEIGESYVVDPVNDLVPVCPNCHTALHSKKDGVYTIDELKKIREDRH